MAYLVQDTGPQLWAPTLQWAWSPMVQRQKGAPQALLGHRKALAALERACLGEDIAPGERGPEVDKEHPEGKWSQGEEEERGQVLQGARKDTFLMAVAQRARWRQRYLGAIPSGLPVARLGYWSRDWTWARVEWVLCCPLWPSWQRSCLVERPPAREENTTVRPHHSCPL